MKSRTGRMFILYAILIALVALVLYPLYFSLISSLKPVAEYSADKLCLPASLFLDNYRHVMIDMKLLRYLGNTIFLVTVAMALYMIVCTAAGFAFGKLQFKGRLPLFTVVLFLQIFPQMVIAGELYQLLSKIHLVNTHAGVIIAWVAYFAPFGTYIMTTYYATVPGALIESARIDGANVFEIFFRIMLPVAKPMLGTICVIGSLAMWNELPFAMLVLQRDGLRTITLGIALMQGEFGLPHSDALGRGHRFGDHPDRLLFRVPEFDQNGIHGGIH